MHEVVEHDWVFNDLSEEVDIKDKYYYCTNCSIVKVIRVNGDINYLLPIKDGFPKKLKGEPPCLQVISK